MKRTSLTALVLSLFMSSSLTVQANTEYYTKNKKTHGVTTSVSVESVDYTNPNYNDGTGSMYAGIRGGDLKILNTPSYSLNKNFATSDHVEYSVNFNPSSFTILDERFSGKGWTLMLEADRLSIIYPTSAKGKKYSANSGYITMSGNVELDNFDTPVVLGTGIESGKPSKIPSSPTIFNFNNSVNLDEKPVTLIEAYRGEGMGEWKVDLSNLIVKIKTDKMLKQDKDVFPNGLTPYTTKLTWTLVSGPGQ